MCCVIYCSWTCPYFHFLQFLFNLHAHFKNPTDPAVFTQVAIAMLIADSNVMDHYGRFVIRHRVKPDPHAFAEANPGKANDNYERRTAMCPACVTSVLLMAVSASSTGSLTVLAIKKLYSESRRNYQTEEAEEDRTENRNNGTQS
jgi:hypothetical protein